MLIEFFRFRDLLRIGEPRLARTTFSETKVCLISIQHQGATVGKLFVLFVNIH